MFNRLPPRRLISLLLTLVLVFSLIPLSASAESSAASPDFSTILNDSRDLFIQVILTNNLSYDDFINAFGGMTDEELAILHSFAGDLFAELALHKTVVPHICVWTYGTSRTSHFQYCCTGCDARKNTQSHNHDGENGNCTCGYHYYTNATLTALGLEGLELDQPFDPAVTEYTAKPVSWKNVTETKINAFLFDELATMEISKDLTVKPGAVYTITITADDDKTTNTYTITVAE